MSTTLAIGRPQLNSALASVVPLAIFLALLGYFGLRAPGFLEPATLILILKQAIPTAVLGLGLAIVVIAGGDDVVAGGIDLSVPSIAVLSAAIIADQLASHGSSAATAVALGFAAAIAAGAANALLVTRVGMTPLLATLATSTAYIGLSKVVTANRRIDLADPLIVTLRDGTVLGLPLGVVVATGLVAIAHIAVHRSRWGLRLQAVGGNRDAAEIAGLKVHRFLAQSFLIAGAFGGAASLFVLARGSGSTPGVAETLLMEMVLATFLGAAFSPRRVVTVWGAVLGAILVSALSIGFGSVGVDVFWTGCIKGGLILIVVAASALAKRNRT
ncbi:MAG: hypothetical protein H6Q99_3945 [Proteobacteria bacterium]|nr:hypothetical protein [Pseudomonadota bacterium]